MAYASNWPSWCPSPKLCHIKWPDFGTLDEAAGPVLRCALGHMPSCTSSFSSPSCLECSPVRRPQEFKHAYFSKSCSHCLKLPITLIVYIYIYVCIISIYVCRSSKSPAKRDQSTKPNGLETSDKKPPLCFPSWRAQRLTPKSPMGGTVMGGKHGIVLPTLYVNHV